MNPISQSALRHLVSALVAFAALASSWSSVANAAGPQTLVLYCGVVAANPTTSGEGSGPNTYELRVTKGPTGAAASFTFGVAQSIALPTIGTYICGQFAEGAPMNALMTLVRPGDPGYVASTLPSTSTLPNTGAGMGVWLLLTGFVALAGVGLHRSRGSLRSTGRGLSPDRCL
jgi:LPXTG-motif cell wall-anchored protein